MNVQFHVQKLSDYIIYASKNPSVSIEEAFVFYSSVIPFIKDQCDENVKAILKAWNVDLATLQPNLVNLVSIGAFCITRQYLSPLEREDVEKSVLVIQRFIAEQNNNQAQKSAPAPAPKSLPSIAEARTSLPPVEGDDVFTIRNESI